MRILRNILAFVLMLFMTLAVSGLNFHFHFCSKENKLYAETHFFGEEQKAIFCECSMESKSCCSDINNKEPKNTDSDDSCIDFEKGVKTDLDYKLSQNQFEFQLSEIELFNFKQNEYYSSGKEEYLIHRLSLYSPPDQAFFCTFLL